jgi:hypothetical protein
MDSLRNHYKITKKEGKDDKFREAIEEKIFHMVKTDELITLTPTLLITKIYFKLLENQTKIVVFFEKFYEFFTIRAKETVSMIMSQITTMNQDEYTCDSPKFASLQILF